MDWVSGRLEQFGCGGRLLILDEWEGSADDVAEASRDAGVECVRCLGEEPLRMMGGRVGFDAVICGWHEGEDRPGRLVECVRKLGYNGPVIAVLDRKDEETMRAARDAGADDVVVHPVRQEAVRDVLSRWARSR